MDNPQSDNLEALETLNLPELKIGPIKYSIGEASILLRKQSKLKILERILVKISPRVKEPAYLLDNGETIIITSRKKVKRPDNINGILHNKKDGDIDWQSHKLIDKVQNKIDELGLAEYANQIPNNWKNKFQYKAEAKEIIDNSDFGLRPPQLGAIHAVGVHWSINNTPATLVMPTGTGKTETMLAVQFAQRLN